MRAGFRRASPKVLAEYSGRCEMDRFELWQKGALRGANMMGPYGARLADLPVLRAWGANLISFGVETVLAFEPPFALREDAFGEIERALDAAREAGLYAAINFRSAPGRKDFNYDLAFFEDFAYHDAFVRMWRETAHRLRGRAELVAYDLMCEPHPEDLFQSGPRAPADLPQRMQGTPADWNLLARRATEAIREEDADTPIIVNASAWAGARGFAYLEPTGDARTIYSVHCYSPRRFTHQKPEERMPYPGFVPGHSEPDQDWDRSVIEQVLRPVRTFQESHGAPIFLGEFGCRRFAPGADAYLTDVLDLAEEWGWTWAYWVFRGGRDWDVELGPDPNEPRRQPDAPLLRLFQSYFARNQLFPALR